jgi:hypothetical protein
MTPVGLIVGLSELSGRTFECEDCNRYEIVVPADK